VDEQQDPVGRRSSLLRAACYGHELDPGIARRAMVALDASFTGRANASPRSAPLRSWAALGSSLGQIHLRQHRATQETVGIGRTRSCTGLPAALTAAAKELRRFEGAVANTEPPARAVLATPAPRSETWPVVMVPPVVERRA
jgi:hypothetical protein